MLPPSIEGEDAFSTEIELCLLYKIGSKAQTRKS